MELTKQLAIRNVVLLAKNFNPSIFSQVWLVENGFFGKEDFLPESVFSSEMVQVRSKAVNMFVIQPQLQFAVQEGFDWDNSVKILLAIIDKLPEIPYTAAGINFHWLVRTEKMSIEEFSRTLFFNEKIPFMRGFDATGAKFGFYVSKDFEKSRLKLDIKPVVATDIGRKSTFDAIQFVFNFHFDVAADGEKPANQLKQYISSSNLLFEEAEKVMSSIN